MAKVEAYKERKEAIHLFEAQTRVRYQKTIDRIVTRIKDNGENAKLLEDVLNLAGACLIDGPE